MMLFGFGRVSGCLGLGALFLWDEWREGRTDRQSASGVGHRRCVGCGWGEFFAVCREGIGE